MATASRAPTARSATCAACASISLARLACVLSLPRLTVSCSPRPCPSDGLAAKELNKSGTTSPTTLSPVVPHGPIFSASGKPKLLRKGKRVQMVQSAFGGAPVRLSASTPARAPQGSRRTTISSADESVKTESSSATRSPETAASELGGLCLTPAFLTSDFYRRFCIQRAFLNSVVERSQADDLALFPPSSRPSHTSPGL